MNLGLIDIFYIMHTTVFFMLSIALYMVIIPSKKEFADYRKSRRILGFAFMMISVLGALRILFPPTEDKSYLDYIIILVFCLVFNCLNFISFLYMIETSRPKRKTTKKTAVISGVLILSLAVSGYVFPNMKEMMTFVMATIYVTVCIFTFTNCLREYDKFVLQMDKFYDVGINIKWMPPLLWASFFLSLIMVGAFLYSPAYLITCIGSVIVYMIIAMKVLSFIPANLNAVRKKIKENEETNVEELETKDIEEEIEVKARPEIAIHTKKGYAKIGNLVERWIENGNYCKPDISIKDAASEMGTNSNYLSLYINKELNTTFANWLNTLRVEKSKEYLCGEERISVEECGEKVGYVGIYNYSRWFKIITGMSPTEWRKTQCQPSTPRK